MNEIITHKDQSSIDDFMPNDYCKGCRLIKDNICIMYNISVIDELDFDCTNRYYENELLNVRIEDENNERLFND